MNLLVTKSIIIFSYNTYRLTLFKGTAMVKYLSSFSPRVKYGKTLVKYKALSTHNNPFETPNTTLKLISFNNTFPTCYIDILQAP